MPKHEIHCPHKIPISTCPEHWAMFKEMTDPEQTDIDAVLRQLINDLNDINNKPASIDAVKEGFNVVAEATAKIEKLIVEAEIRGIEKSQGAISKLRSEFTVTNVSDERIANRIFSKLGKRLSELTQPNVNDEKE